MFFRTFSGVENDHVPNNNIPDIYGTDKRQNRKRPDRASVQAVCVKDSSKKGNSSNKKGGSIPILSQNTIQREWWIK